jgi:hypothetical protein
MVNGTKTSPLLGLRPAVLDHITFSLHFLFTIKIPLGAFNKN